MIELFFILSCVGICMLVAGKLEQNDWLLHFRRWK